MESPTRASCLRAQRPRAQVSTAGAIWQESPKQSAQEHQRILSLLRRGAGVTQILRETGKPRDTPAEQLIRANRLHRILERPSPGEVRLEPRKLMRTLAYLEHRIGLLQAEVEWARHTRPRGGVTTDSYGAQVQVRDGLPSFTMVAVRDEMQRILGEDLRKRLGTLWPSRRITVVIPDGWTPSTQALMSLARAIHIEHTY